MIVGVTIGLSVFLSFVAERRKKFFYVFLCIVLLSLLSGLRRADVGLDTINYYEFFESINSGSYTFVKDYGFFELSRFLLYILKTPQNLILFYATLINVLIICRIWSMKNRASFLLMMVAYITFYYFQSFNIMRQCVALAITFAGSIFIEKKKYLIYLVFVVAGSLIHFSAIISLVPLVVYLFIDKSNNKTAKILFLIFAFGAIPLTIFLFSRYFGRYSRYFDSISFDFSPLVLIELFLALFVIISRKKRAKTTEKNINRAENLIFVLGLFLSSFGMFFSFMDRIGACCTIYEIPFWGNNRKFVNKADNQIFIIMFLLLCAYCLISVFVANGSHIFPYHTIFEKYS